MSKKRDPRTNPADPRYDREYAEAYGRKFRAAMKGWHRHKHRWSSYLVSCDRQDRVKAFSDIAPQLTDKEYWSLLSYVWTDSETIFANLWFWLEAFGSQRPEREQFMSAEERAFLASLPDQITVYRGYRPQANNEIGFSWTLSREVAERLANRAFMRGLKLDKAIIHPGGEVIERVISKADVFAYCNDERQEQEIILTPAALQRFLGTSMK
jgi:hypothetical protein